MHETPSAADRFSVQVLLSDIEDMSNAATSQPINIHQGLHSTDKEARVDLADPVANRGAPRREAPNPVSWLDRLIFEPKWLRTYTWVFNT